MARRVRKQCISCQQLFIGRRDAKTCSERCRKRLQRARDLVEQDLGTRLQPEVPASPQALGAFDSRYSTSNVMTSRRRSERQS